MTINVEKVHRKIRVFLNQNGYAQRDADPSDLRGPGSLRFKTGTVYGEVTVVVLDGSRTIDTIRILNEGNSFVEAVNRLEEFVCPRITVPIESIPVEGGSIK